MSRNVLERPVVAVDVVALRVAGGRLGKPSAGARRAVRGRRGVARSGSPGGRAAGDRGGRALVEKAGAPGRRPRACTWNSWPRSAPCTGTRGRTVSVAYLALARGDEPVPVRGRWAAAVGHATQALPFDHEAVVATAVSRLKGKLRYTNIARHLLPPEFRIEELQAVCEAVLGRKVNKTNFRSPLLQRRLIERVRILAEAVGGKAAGRLTCTGLPGPRRRGGPGFSITDEHRSFNNQAKRPTRRTVGRQPFTVIRLPAAGPPSSGRR